MAPRARAAMADDVFEDSSTHSSPDPLNASISAAALRRKSSRFSKAPLAASSPSKSNRRPSIGDCIEVSPSKSMIMQTGRSGGASPWRIKVTVQAEPGSGSDGENSMSPTVRRMTRTTTTTVPLKDGSASSPVKRRGRPRKSEATASAKPKRNGTPIRKRSQSKGRNSSIARSEVSLADASSDAAPKKRRGRPRKSIQPVVDQSIQTTVSESETRIIEEATDLDAVGPSPRPMPIDVASSEESEDVQEPPAPATSSDQQKVRVASPITEPIPLQPFQERISRHTPPTVSIVAEKEGQSMNTPEHDLARRLRARKGTPHAKILGSRLDSSEDEESEVITPPGTDDDEEAEAQNNKEPMLSTATTSNAPEETISNPDSDEDSDDEPLPDPILYAFDEGATRMPGDTTILDSENFSMISVDSLPSSGGFSSPPGEETKRIPSQSLYTALGHSKLEIPRTEVQRTHSSPHNHTTLSSVSLSNKTATLPQNSSPPLQSRREKTPLMESRSPSDPPAIVPAPYSPSEVATPRIGRVVRAGVALQGVLDPVRLTPTEKASEQTVEKQQDPLEDLFRGFSEGTRKQLQAGLKLGEQLAREGNDLRIEQQSSPAFSSPTKSATSKSSNDDVFSSSAESRISRLLTPEDQGDYTLPVPPPATEIVEVSYPALPAENSRSQLISPARSEDEMSWRVDTPPVRTDASVGPRMVTAFNDRGEEIHGSEIYIVADGVQEDNVHYSDLWQEEAARDHNRPHEKVGSSLDQSPQLSNLFNSDGPVKPTRGKLPKTWRRKSSNNFNYSDEMEEPVQEATPSSSNVTDGTHSSTEARNEVVSSSPQLPIESAPSPVLNPAKGKKKLLTPPLVEEDELDDDDNFSEGSDDTGMFFQSHLPSVFNKRRSAEVRHRRTEKKDVSLLLAEGESLLPDSSPPVSAAKTPGESKPNPFKNTPPRFPALYGSPVKSSPLRYELRASDSDQSSRNSTMLEESTLPQSSPFHTNVDITMASVASDVLQLQAELENAGTDSSLRHVREEADAHAYAYESQYRTLDEIEEVTEPSRTKSIIMLPSSPPSATEESRLLRPRREYSPLFGDDGVDSSSGRSTLAPKQQSRVLGPKPAIAITPPTEDPPQLQQQPGGFFGMFTSLFSGRSATAPPALHPVAMKYSALPKIEPWTKSHYKTLDALYQSHKKNPSLFDPAPPSVNAASNKSLLTKFLADSGMPFVGATYACWGYSVTLTEPLVVLCAVYSQLLTFKDIEEYEGKNGKEIEVGDCGPREAGLFIEAENVVVRLATVVMGEALRRDERKGKKNIVREGGMDITWP